MSAIETLLRQPAAQAMGWALLHFVWQGALIGLLTAGALAALRRSAADVRYVVAAIGMSLMLTMPVVTATQMWRADAAAPPAAGLWPDAAGQASPRLDRSAIDPPLSAVRSAMVGGGAAALRQSALDSWVPFVVLGWLCGVAILTLRLMSGWLWVQRMKSHGAVPADEGWQAVGVRLSRRLHIGRRVQLLQSSLVDVPTVIGWIKPVVLLPASALAGLTPHQLEAILAHEFAHIRRHDYLVNLLQTLVETLLFYHPAVWWLSRRIRAERENCCDDLAVSLCGDPYTYAKALADLEELRGAGGQLMMAASGGSLVQRVRRLLGAPTHAGRAPGWLAGGATIVVMLGIAAGAVGTDAGQDALATTPANASARPVTPSELEPAARAAQSPEQAQVAAAANRMRQKADIYRWAAHAASSLQQATGQASTPLLAGQTLAAQADAFQEAARAMAAQAGTRPAAIAGPAAQASHDHAALAAMDAGRASTMPGAAGALAPAALPGLATEPAIAAAHWQALAAHADAVSAAAVASTRSPAAALAPSAGLAIGSQQSRGNYSWSNNGEKLEVKYDGEFDFTDDDTDVKRLSPGGSLQIKDGGWLGRRTIEFKADPSGQITRRFWVGITEHPFDPDGRLWLAKMLPRFIRQSGIGAPGRVARILKAKGPAGVLAEISLIEGSWSKRLYFKELLKTSSLDAATLRQLLVQAGREIDSDFELASLLIEGADTLLVDEGTRQAYFAAAKSIGSDFEMRRVFGSALKRGQVSSGVLAGILDASQIDSDFEQASLLIQIAKLQPLDNTTRTPFFNALATVDSDFEHRRVLSALAERTDLGPETTTAMLQSIASVQSDFEAASFLLQVAKQHPIEGTLRAPFFRAVESLGSTFERGRVLQAVVRRAEVSDDTILASLRAAGSMSGSFETSQVLLATAQGRTLSGAARDAYIDAAEKLGDFEQGRVLAALVRSERRK